MDGCNKAVEDLILRPLVPLPRDGVSQRNPKVGRVSSVPLDTTQVQEERRLGVQGRTTSPSYPRRVRPPDSCPSVGWARRVVGVYTDVQQDTPVWTVLPPFPFRYRCRARFRDVTLPPLHGEGWDRDRESEIHVSRRFLRHWSRVDPTPLGLGPTGLYRGHPGRECPGNGVRVRPVGVDQ